MRRNQPVVVHDLGASGPVSQAIGRWRKSLGRTGDAIEAAAELRRTLWEPLAPSIGNWRLILVSPDGPLTRFPFAALPGSEPGSYLIEDVAVAVVPVPQDLPRLLAAKTTRSEKSPPSQPVLMLVGDVDYDLRGDQAGGDMVAPTTFPRLRLHFNPLENTRGEILAVRDSFERAYPQGAVRFLRQRQATKEAFCREATNCRYLLLATHGFLIEPIMVSEHDNSAAASRSLLPGGSLLNQQELANFHPAVSGLALAGEPRIRVGRHARHSDRRGSGRHQPR